MAQSRKHNAWNEVLGLMFLGTGTVLFLALISYAPKDVPSWFVLSSANPANNPAQNFIGPTGALIACVFYFTLGAAPYLVAAILLGFGGAKLFLPGFRIKRRLFWAVLSLGLGASLAQVQNQFLHSWKREFNIDGPGGWVGHYLGGSVVENLLGQVGSLIALMVAYVISLIYLTGIRPIFALGQLLRGIKNFFV